MRRSTKQPARVDSRPWPARRGGWATGAFVVGVAIAGCRPPPKAVEPRTDPEAGPPVAPREATQHTIHGRMLVDPYAWLRDRDDPRTRAYLDAENAFAESVLGAWSPLHGKVVAELRGRVVAENSDAPLRDGPYIYTTRRVAGGDYWRVERRPTAGGETKLVFDADARARGHEYFSVGGWEISPDHRRLAWAEDNSGDERHRIAVMDLETGETIDTLDDGGAGFGGTMVWSADSQTLWATRLDDAHREHELWRYEPGRKTPPVLAFAEDDPRYSVTAARSRDDRWIVLHVASSVTSEVHLLDARRPSDPWRLVEPRRQGVECEIAVLGDRMFKRTNAKAPEFEVFTATLGAKDHGDWRPFAAPTGDQTFSGLDLFADHLVVTGRGGGLPQIWVYPVRGGAPRQLAWPDAAYDVSLGANPEAKPDALRVEYSSPVTPATTFDVSFTSGERVAVDRDVVPAFDAAVLEVERTTARATDGAEIPVTIVRRRDAPRPGPLLLQGYGAYGSSWDPGFVAGDLPLLDRGVTLAIAHVRGGGELGKRWHDAGKLTAKSNSFTDFIAVAQMLIERGDTTRDRLAISGGSAGGLLMGAVLNLRPDLFAAAIAQVPFVDVINTMRDASLPLTAGEWEEWGNPEIAADFATMVAYSPYDNVADRSYPAMLVTAGFNDPRVGYWEPAKWVARMRAEAKHRGPLLLRTQMGAGHSGSTGRYGALGEQAWELVFVLSQVGGVDRK